jgi:protein-disulfide isomerase
MKNRFVVILVLLVAVFAGLVFFAKKDSDDKSGDGSQVTASAHTQGAGTSGVTLVEFGDFQCPACGAYYPILKQVQEHYGDQITFQYRNFPLVSIHPNAMSAHRAAEAASQQGKFWEMHDILYERQSLWSDSKSASTIFKGYAQELGLDMTRYDADIARAEIGDIIQADQKAGEDLGVNATPGLVLDGKLLDNAPRDVDGFIKIIDEAIAAKQQNTN